MIDFVANRHLIFGENSVDKISDLLKWYNRRKPFLVVYSASAPCVERIIKAIQDAGRTYVIYDKVIKEPDITVIDEGARLCVDNGCDCVIAVGGGSVIDTAKTIAMLATNGGYAEDYQLNGRPVEKMPLTFFAVATTAGTGAEATRVSVVYNQNKGYKKAIYHDSMIAEATILDPMTTQGLPRNIVVSTGMDAITHAIESYVSKNANIISRAYSIKALELLFENINEATDNPQNTEARGNMLLGSYYAGCAISAGTTLAHIVGQPLGALYHIPHGDSCTIFLAPSMRLNVEYCEKGYAELARVMHIDTSGKNEWDLAHEAIATVETLASSLGAPSRLTQYVSPKEIDIEAALDNIQTSMGHIKTNPRPVTRALIKELIQSVI